MPGLGEGQPDESGCADSHNSSDSEVPITTSSGDVVVGRDRIGHAVDVKGIVSLDEQHGCGDDNAVDLQGWNTSETWLSVLYLTREKKNVQKLFAASYTKACNKKFC